MGYAAGEVCGDRSTPKLRYAAEVGGRKGIGKNGKPYGKAAAVGIRNDFYIHTQRRKSIKEIMLENFRDLPQILTTD